MLKDCLGITASYKLTTVKEKIRFDMRSDVRHKTPVSSGKIQGDQPILTQLFKERYSKDKAAIEDAAFKQLEEQEEKQLRNLKRKHLETPNQQPQQQQQLRRGMGNFRNFSEAPVPQRTFKDRPCRDYNYNPRGCWRGELGCKFGHFLDPQKAGPTAGSGQPALAPAASYSGISHGTSAGPQR